MKFESIVEWDKFIENNLGLVKSRVLELNNNFFDEDLFQVGSLALIIAVDRFNEYKTNKFSTYAVKYIDGYILKHKRYNAIIKPLRKNSGEWWFSYKDVVGLEDSIIEYKTSERELEDMVLDEIMVTQFIDELTERDKMVILLKMSGAKQSEISQMACINQSKVSRVINRRGREYINQYSV